MRLPLLWVGLPNLKTLVPDGRYCLADEAHLGLCLESGHAQPFITECCRYNSAPVQGCWAASLAVGASIDKQPVQLSSHPGLLTQQLKLCYRKTKHASQAGRKPSNTTWHKHCCPALSRTRAPSAARLHLAGAQQVVAALNGTCSRARAAEAVQCEVGTHMGSCLQQAGRQLQLSQLQRGHLL